MNPRAYQIAALDAIDAGWQQFRRQLLVLPTGCGKTIVFALFTLGFVRLNKRVLILAHREELLTQAQDKLLKATGLPSVLEKAESKAYELFNAGDLFTASVPRVVVGSVQTLTTNRLKKWDPNTFDAIVIDEAHHSLAEGYQRVLNHFKKAVVLGVTATPDRGDKKNLGTIFENIAYEYSIAQAIKDGFLAPIMAKLIPLKIDLTAVRTVAGDYDLSDLDANIAPYLEQIADEVAKNIGNRRTLVFLPLVRTSQMFAAMMNARGISSMHIDGASPDRRDILRSYERGEFQLLTNSSLLLEGYDCPEISCVIVLRPTKVRALFIQCIGRGTRIAEGKDDLLILDFLWQATTHSLCTPASLIASSDEEAKQIMDIVGKVSPFIDDDDEPIDLLSAQSQAKDDAKAARERKLAETIKAQENKKKKTMDPVAFALAIHDDELQEYEPMFAWEAGPASEKQLNALEKFGIDPDAVNCMGLASKLLDKCFTRMNLGLCSAKQAKLLRRYGLDATWATRDAASAAIGAIAGNGWQLPRGYELETTPPDSNVATMEEPYNPLGPDEDIPF